MKRAIAHLIPLLLVFAAIACSEGEATYTSVSLFSQPTEALPTEPPVVVSDTPPPTDTAIPADTPKPQSTDTPMPTDTLEPELQPPFLGDVVEQDGVLLAAVTVEDPTIPGSSYVPETGMKLVAVEIIIGNASGDTISVNPLSAVLVDNEGFRHEVELGKRDEQIATVALAPGEKVRGWIPFKIPDGATPAKIKYATEFSGGTSVEADLAPPPVGREPDNQALVITPPTPATKLGEAFEQDGYSLSALAVEDPTTPGVFYEPKTGKKLVAVEIVVGNVSGEQLGVNPLFALLIDSEGYVYEVELAGRAGQINARQLDQGEKTQGWVAFEIPEDAAPASLKYITEYFEDVFLQVGLTQ